MKEVLLALLLAYGSQDMTIDARGREAQESLPQKNVAIRAGSMGRTLRLKVQASPRIQQARVGSEIPLEILLTNAGNDPITLPVVPASPDPESHGNVILRLSIVPFIDADNPRLLRGGAQLYAFANDPASLHVLRPGGTMKILATIELGFVNSTQTLPTDKRIYLRTSLSSQTSKSEANGQRIELMETGSVVSSAIPLKLSQ